MTITAAVHHINVSTNRIYIIYLRHVNGDELFNSYSISVDSYGEKTGSCDIGLKVLLTEDDLWFIQNSTNNLSL
jgi:hypothetical protein